MIGRRPKIVTSIAMFYDLEQPVGFAQNIARLLSHDGVWILEMSYLPLMLLQNSFDTICHEHLEYYSLAVLDAIVAKANMRIFKVSISDINGGSIRCYAARASNSTYGTADDRAFIHRLRIREFEMELDLDNCYVEFQQRIDRLKEELNSTLFRIRARGERIHLYGASTKGNVLLQFCGLTTADIPAIADVNPEKFGCVTPGTHIPIVSEEGRRCARSRRSPRSRHRVRRRARGNRGGRTRTSRPRTRPSRPRRGGPVIKHRVDME